MRAGGCSGGRLAIWPNLFFQGFLAFATAIAQEGRFFAPIGDAGFSAVDVRDIASVAAAALTDPGHLGKTQATVSTARGSPTSAASVSRGSTTRAKSCFSR
jgi:uncharacterized protein YbjT (DUF2867 family)